MRLHWIKSWCCIVGLCVLLAATPSHAADAPRSILQYEHKAWAHAQGAPTDIYTIAHGNDGYLWLGTEQGLFRFDGMAFEAVRSLDGQEIPKTPIYYLVTGPDGAIWFRLKDGIARLDRGHLAATDTSTWPRDWRNFVIDRDGVFWFNTRNGALWRVQEGNALEVGADWSFHFSKSTRRMFVDRLGGLWIVSANTVAGGFAHLARGAKAFVTNPTVGPTSICEGNGGDIWFSGPARLTYIPADAPATSKPLAGSVGPSNICMGDREGGIWVGYKDGIALVDDRAGRAARGRADTTPLQVLEPRQGLSADVIYTIFEDREGNVWTGTPAGLDRFRKTTMVPVTLPRRSFSFAIAPGDAGTIWAANYNGGLMKVDGARIEEFPDVGPNITTIHRSAQGTIWVGSNSHALWRSNASGGFDKVPIPDDVVYDNLSGFTQDRTGTIWIGLSSGVAKLVDGRWAGYSRGDGIPPGYEALAMLTDRTGALWLGGRDDIRVGEPGNFRTLTHTDHAMPGGATRLIYERGPHLWIATAGGGCDLGWRRLQRIEGRPWSCIRRCQRHRGNRQRRPLDARAA